MVDSIGQICFLCGESHSKLFYQYTEPVCESCLNFKGLTRIEGIIGNKRRLKKQVPSTTDISAENSTSHHTNAREIHHIERVCLRETSLSVGDTGEELSPQRTLASETKRSASVSPRISRLSLNNEIDKSQIRGRRKCSDEPTRTVINFSLMESGSSSESVSEEPVTKMCDSRIKIVIKNSLQLVIPLPFGTIQGQAAQDNVQELSVSTKYGNYRISESVALEAVKALKCNPFCTKASAKVVDTSSNPTSNRDDYLLPPRQSLKRSSPDSRSKVGSKRRSYSLDVTSPVIDKSETCSFNSTSLLYTGNTSEYLTDNDEVFKN